MRKSLVPAVCCLLIAAACVPGSSDGASDEGAATDLTWQMWLSGNEDREAWQQVADQVTEDHPDLRVDLRGAPWDNYWEKVGALLASGDAPCLISMQGPLIGGYAPQLLPLDDLMAKHGVEPEEFDDAALASMQVDGVQHGLPYDTGPIVLYYNRELFQDAGIAEPEVGWTMTEFREAARELTGDGTHGFAASPDDDFFTASWVLNLSGSLVAEDEVLTVDTPEFRRGYAAYVEILQDRSMAPNLPAQAGPFVEAQFTSGSIGMVAHGPWMLQGFQGQVDFELGMAPLPAGPEGSRSISGGSGFGISRSCPDPDAAFRALSSMTGEDALSGLANEGRAFPARPAVQDGWYDAAEGVYGVHDSLTSAVEQAEPYTTTEDWSQLKELLARSTQQAVAGDLTPAEALRRVQAQQVP